MQKGFSLAEVLITLGIIGVIAAMTMPVLLTSVSKHQTEVKLKKAASLINQAYRTSYNDNGDLNAQDAKKLGDIEYFNTYWRPYIKAYVCNTYKECGYNTNIPWKFFNGRLYPCGVVSPGYRITFRTPNGIVFIINLYNDTANLKPSTLIWIDLNGGNAPNIVGKDVFVFERLPNEGGVAIVPVGSDKSETEINSNCSKTPPRALDSYCAEKIRRAGWKIDSSYPW